MEKHRQYIIALERSHHAQQSGLLGKLIYRPIEFFKGFFINKIYYPIARKPQKVTCKTICNDDFVVWLPAGLDIFLLGMKSHDAELRLTRYILHSVHEGTFIDIGAHFGFYTLLASNLLADSGQVHSVEPSRKTFEILSENSSGRINVQLHHNAVSDQGPIVLREYDVSHSEYNKLVGREGQQSEDFDQVNYDEYKVECLTLDALAGQLASESIFIKMDVEGAEYEALLGGQLFLSQASPTIAMEYHVEDNDFLSGCQKGAKLLINLDYKPYVINEAGHLVLINGSIDTYLTSLGRDVDNLIFKK